jgi:hypothetical protein
LLPYFLPTKTAQRHAVLSWYTYSGAPPSCNCCYVCTVMRKLIVVRHNKTRLCCYLSVTVSRTFLCSFLKNSSLRRLRVSGFAASDDVLDTQCREHQQCLRVARSVYNTPLHLRCFRHNYKLLGSESYLQFDLRQNVLIFRTSVSRAHQMGHIFQSHIPTTERLQNMTTTHLQQECAAVHSPISRAKLSLSMNEVTPPLPQPPLRRAQRQI